MDSFSMFEDIAPGVDSSITGVITLLAVIHTMAKVKQNLTKESANPIMFTFFNGVSYNRVGKTMASVLCDTCLLAKMRMKSEFN